ncbi:hypothetical protein [Streptomyces sp. NPDC008121]|uniref:hypothetical protein n=1 Tax=Streptomyces sp. NPDC008121 TaxID=3364809 RepID=UPI0036E0A081
MGSAVDRGRAGVLASVRAGDVVVMECPAQTVEVTGLSAEYVSVRWPWNRIDPESQMQWNGSRAIPRNAGDEGWDEEPFQIVSSDSSLEVGGYCELGMPATVAYVVHVERFSDPLDVGWLPRPHAYVSLVSHGVSFPPHAEEIGFTVDPNGEEPIESALVFRPYAFLESGDEVADSEGRLWTYSAPWKWVPFDGRPGEYPAWPLQLICRDGGQVPHAAQSIARATSVGVHDDEMARWLRAAGLAEVPQLPPRAFIGDLPH